MKVLTPVTLSDLICYDSPYSLSLQLNDLGVDLGELESVLDERFSILGARRSESSGSRQS